MDKKKAICEYLRKIILAKKMPSTARSLKSCFCLTDEIFAARSVPCGRMAFLFAAMKRATITQTTKRDQHHRLPVK